MVIQKKPKAPATDTQSDALDKFINAAPDARQPAKKGVAKGKKQQITITMDPELIERIDEAAAENGQSRAAFINMSCINVLDYGLQIAGKKKISE
ncbi:TPA: CopG family transcriptional regulator [Enterobacter hormaechei subsp. steigerwaltii]|nr:CopG family transcriptional regulator [Enterobacter hormaechei subsp. steigerwaltii]